jgi:diguanylate cyclase (GGDEF)-like protein
MPCCKVVFPFVDWKSAPADPARTVASMSNSAPDVEPKSFADPAVLPAVALAFASVPVDGSAHRTATACVEAIRTVIAGKVRLVIPMSPVSFAAGDLDPDLALLFRFPAAAAEGELWVGSGGVPEAVRDALHVHLDRTWRAQNERAAQLVEIEQLKFQLASLQQVVRTLAVARGAEETERLILDSVGEVFFAWWAALYRSEDHTFVCRGIRALRGEAIEPRIPAALVLEAAPVGGGAVVLPESAELRRHLPRDVSVLAPLDLGDAGAGCIVLGPRLSNTDYADHDLALLRALADSSAIALRNADLVERLRKQASFDPLTGCRNRREFEEHLNSEFARARRYDRPLSLILLDIDHFKRINDDLGHEVGDHALRRIGGALCQAGRATDVVCRYGGEEFAIICPETPRDEAIRFAERLRVLIEELQPDDAMPRAITASLGVAAYPEDADGGGTLLRASDRALYQAKAMGRNRVMQA